MELFGQIFTALNTIKIAHLPLSFFIAVFIGFPILLKIFKK